MLAILLRLSFNNSLTAAADRFIQNQNTPVMWKKIFFHILHLGQYARIHYQLKLT